MNINEIVEVLQRLLDNPETYGIYGKTAEAFQYAIQLLSPNSALPEKRTENCTKDDIGFGWKDGHNYCLDLCTIAYNKLEAERDKYFQIGLKSEETIAKLLEEIEGWEENYKSKLDEVLKLEAELDKEPQLKKELDKAKKEIEELKNKLGGDVLYKGLANRLIGQIVKHADMSLPESTDIELSLMRIINERNQLKQRASVEEIAHILFKNLREENQIHYLGEWKDLATQISKHILGEK